MKNDCAELEVPGRGKNSTFSQVLDEVVRADDSERRFGRFGKTLGHPFDSFAPPIGSDANKEFAAAERWDQALDWITEPSSAAGAAKTASAPSDDPAAIAAELGLTNALTHGELNRARRRFMWNNHPDRRPDVPRDLANRRVAIANMLLDRAQNALAGRRRAP